MVLLQLLNQIAISKQHQQLVQQQSFLLCAQLGVLVQYDKTDQKTAPLNQTIASYMTDGPAACVEHLERAVQAAYKGNDSRTLTVHYINLCCAYLRQGKLLQQDQALVQRLDPERFGAFRRAALDFLL